MTTHPPTRSRTTPASTPPRSPPTGAFAGKIGIARRDITPPVGIFSRNWGAAKGDVATGVHRPLTLTALTLQSTSGGPLVIIDTDLGWELLIALVASDRAGDAEIDERLASDNTATGQQSAAHARAAIQTPEGKERAWASLIDVDTATNTVVRETAEGFLRASDPALLEAFVERYFAMLEDVWDQRSYAIAEKLVDGLYPSPLATLAVSPPPPT